MLKAMHKSLAVRSVATILILVSGLGLVVLGLSLLVVYQGESNRQERQLDTLLDTVESTVQIAAFLSDQELAREVVQGLRGNDIVQAAALYADGQLLAQSGYEGARETLERDLPLNGTVLQRSVRSPFDADEVVGVIYMLPNHAEMQATVLRSALFVALMLTLFLVAVAAGTVWVVVRFVTRPIVRLSASLHGLNVEGGGKLQVSPQNAGDELGLLVMDVNRMIDRLVEIIGEERQLREEREIRERRFRTIFENAETGIFLMEADGSLSSHNPAFARCLRLDTRILGDVEGTNLYRLLPSQAKALRHMVQRCRDGQRTVEAELEVGVAPDKTWLQVTLSAVGEDRYQGVANDITERKLAQQEAEDRAATDALTGIGNRAGFENRLARLIALQQHDGKRFALLLMDLDHFKAANDTFGHQAGDQVLQIIAGYLRAMSRKTDYAARLGGDEFVLLLSDADDREAVGAIAAELVALAADPIELEADAVIHISASVGVAFSRTGETGANLIRRADTALYEAKHKGRNQYRVLG